jgi:hypothetical protein
MIDITQKGVLPGNSAELNSPAIESLFSQNLFGRYYAPPGVYRFTRQTVIKNASFILDGAGVPAAGPGTGFRYDGPGAVFYAEEFKVEGGKTHAGRFTFSNLHIRNNLGDGVLLNGLTFHNRFLNCNFEGCGLNNPDYAGTGLSMDYSDCIEVTNCYFGANDIGAKICGNADIRLATVMGNGDGLWLAHYGNVLSVFRIEVNKRGVVLGRRAPEQGSTKDRNGILAHSEISNGTFEANDIAIAAERPVSNTKLARLRIYGTNNAPSGNSQIGLYIQLGLSNCEVTSLSTTGGFVKGGVVFTKAAATLSKGTTFRNCNVENNAGGVSNPDREWVLEETPGAFRQLRRADVPGCEFVNCNIE